MFNSHRVARCACIFLSEIIEIVEIVFPSIIMSKHMVNSFYVCYAYNPNANSDVG